MFQFKRVARVIAIHALMLLGAAEAWAGRGDIDPNYGDAGRLATASPSTVLALPGDRLMIAEGTGDGFRLRMVDASGRNVPAFGDSGVVLIDSSAAARTFQPEAAAVTPNGDMIFVGSLSDTGARVLLRLDNAGQPVLSFGNRGDGFVEPALNTAVMAIDSTGKIVLAEGSGNRDHTSCGSTARLQRLLANGQPDTGFGGDGIIEIPNLAICNGAAVFGARTAGGVIVGDVHTIVALDAAGDLDPTFAVDGRLAVSGLSVANGLLLPQGSLLIVGWDNFTGSNDTVFLKFDRNGQPDRDFGPGTGLVTVDLGTALLDAPSVREYVEQLAIDPDGQHVFAELSLSYADGSTACTGIARLTIDGRPDADFGVNGLTCLDFNFALIAAQSDGAPLFSGNDDSIHRLLPNSSASPGFLRVVLTSFELSTVGEAEGTATVAIQRFAGRDGAVSVNYAAVHRSPLSRFPYHFESADVGSDYVAASGRLDWASGDDSQRTVNIRILNDSILEPWEWFSVEISEPTGGAQVTEASRPVIIDDDDGAAPPPPPPSPPPPPDTGGGGSVSWATALALLTLLFIGRGRSRRANQLG